MNIAFVLLSRTYFAKVYSETCLPGLVHGDNNARATTTKRWNIWSRATALYHLTKCTNESTKKYVQVVAVICTVGFQFGRASVRTVGTFQALVRPFNEIIKMKITWARAHTHTPTKKTNNNNNPYETCNQDYCYLFFESLLSRSHVLCLSRFEHSFHSTSKVFRLCSHFDCNGKFTHFSFLLGSFSCAPISPFFHRSIQAPNEFIVQHSYSLIIGEFGNVHI